MRVVRQHIEHLDPGIVLAARPASLTGKVVGFCDGWGRKNEDGTYGMYPMMAAICTALEAQFDIRSTFWERKPNVCQPIPRSMVDEFASRADVIVNGQCI